MFGIEICGKIGTQPLSKEQLRVTPSQGCGRAPFIKKRTAVIYNGPS